MFERIGFSDLTPEVLEFYKRHAEDRSGVPLVSLYPVEREGRIVVRAVAFVNGRPAEASMEFETGTADDFDANEALGEVGVMLAESFRYEPGS